MVGSLVLRGLTGNRVRCLRRGRNSVGHGKIKSNHNGCTGFEACAAII
jgi:hypothetical protein